MSINLKTENNKENKDKQKQLYSSRRGKYITTTGIMAALIVLMTAYICHIPLGINGGYIHFGDALIYLAAVLLPKPYALAAAGIGGGLADLMTAPMWMGATIIIKMLIVLPFTEYSKKIISLRNIVATVLAYFISGIGYFLAQFVLFQTQDVFWISMLQSLVQAVGSTVFFIVFGMALDKVDFKKRLMN